MKRFYLRAILALIATSLTGVSALAGSGTSPALTKTECSCEDCKCPDCNGESCTCGENCECTDCGCAK